ncbi:kelch-like protein [bacterium]|nr:MAG: kelch-like protein [bacterium]
MKTSKVFLLVILTLSSSYLVYIQPVNAAEDSWTTKAPMQTARSFFEVAAVNRKIYAFGGGGANTTEEYDPETNTWTTKASMLTARSGFAVAVFQNKIYVIGGEVIGTGFTGINEVYDPATNTWETKTSMPTKRDTPVANTVDDKICVIGGILESESPGDPVVSDVNEVYDPATDTWTTKASIPNAVYACVSAVVDSKLFVIGGETFSGGVLNQIYDPETDTWSSGKNMTIKMHGMAAAATTGTLAPKRIYVMGGMEALSLEALSTNQIYDPETDTWSTGTAMPDPRIGLAVAAVNDTIYAIGGSPGYGEMQYEPPTATTWQYIPVGYIPEFPSWIILPLLFVATFVAIICKKWLPKKPKQPTEIIHSRRLIKVYC